MDNFDLKKFLTENKLTSNSIITEEFEFNVEDIEQAFDSVPFEELNESMALELLRWLTIVISSLITSGYVYGAWVAWGLPEVKEILERYRLDKNSTKEEVEAAAQEILDSLSPQKRSYLERVMNFMRTGDTKTVRSYYVQKAQDAIKRYKSDLEK